MAHQVIKCTFNGDVRRFQCPTDATFEVLASIIKATYKIESFVLKYSDEEGDQITVDSTQEVKEAFRLHENAVLKLTIFTRSTVSSPTWEKVSIVDTLYSSEETGSVNESGSSEKVVPDATTSTPTTAEVKEPDTNESETNESGDTEQTEAGIPESKKPLSCVEIKELVFSFLKSETARKDFPNAIKAVLHHLVECRDVDKLIYTFVGYSEAIRQHPSVVTLLLHLDQVRPKLEKVVQNINAEIIPFALHLVDDMLPSILQNLENIDNLGNIGSPFPPFFAPFMGGCNPFSTFESQSSSSSTSAPKTTSTTSTNNSDINHVNIVCDGCGVTPIQGARFKCSVCPDFDLCSDCEAKQIHPPHHSLIKFRCSADKAVKPEVRHEGVSCDGCGTVPIKGDRFKCSVCPDYDLCSACESKDEVHPEDHPMIKLRIPKGPTGFRGGSFRGHCRRGAPFGPTGRRCGPMGPMGPLGPTGRRCGPMGMGPMGPLMSMFMHASNTTQPETEVPEPKSAAKSQPKDEESETTPKAEFVQHVTLKDGSLVSPNQTIIKTWSIANSGKQAWPAGSKLIFVRGDRELSLEEEFPQQADLLEPTKTTEVSACLHTPKEAGRYTCYFNMADSDRNLFGPRLGVDLVVEEIKEVKEEVKEETQEASSSPEEPIKYAEQHQQLKVLGFEDQDLNAQLLELHDGNIRAVCQFLFGETP